MRKRVSLVLSVVAGLEFFQPTNELGYLEEYVWENPEVLRDFLINDESPYFESYYEPTLSDFSWSEDKFQELMIQKCHIPKRKFGKLRELYDVQGKSDRQCYDQLTQFNEDLENGNFYALQMCDSWGEDINFRNWPGLQQEIMSPSFYTRTKKPGHINQCRQVHRRSAKVEYKGKWAMSRPIFHRLKQYGKQFADCARNCTDLGNDELGPCILDCYQGFGVTNIKLLDWYRGRGICYPDSCSAEEILILQSNVQNVSNIITFTDSEGYGPVYGLVSKRK